MLQPRHTFHHIASMSTLNWLVLQKQSQHRNARELFYGIVLQDQNIKNLCLIALNLIYAIIIGTVTNPCYMYSYIFVMLCYEKILL